MGANEFRFFLSCDINSLVTFRIEKLDGILPVKKPNDSEVVSVAEDKRPEVYIESALYINGALFGLPMRTRFHDMIKYERGQIQSIDWLDRLMLKSLDTIKKQESSKHGSSHLFLVIDFCSFEHRVVFQESGANLFITAPIGSTMNLLLYGIQNWEILILQRTSNYKAGKELGSWHY